MEGSPNDLPVKKIYMELLPKKITIPLDDHLIKRPRLLEKLEKCAKPFCWITAKPGAGKTSLVASWVRGYKKNVLWYNIDDTDANLDNFIYYLHLAVEKAPFFSGVNHDILQIGESADKRQCLEAYFKELFLKAQSSFVIILDNLQKVPDDSFLVKILANLAEDIPFYAQFVILSHNDPGESFIPVQAYHRVELLHENFLVFDITETKAIMKTIASKTSQDTIETVWKLSKGWVLAIILYAEHLKQESKNSIPGSEILTEVMNKLEYYFQFKIFPEFPEELKMFLVKTSLLPFITVEILQNLNRNFSDEQYIAYLLKNHLFLEERMQGQLKVYNYHDIFKKFLLKQAPELLTESQINGIRRKTAGFLLKKGFIEEASNLYLQLNDKESIISIIGNHTDHLLSCGRYSIILNLFQIFDQKDYQNHPSLYYWEGRLTQMSGFQKSQALFESGFYAAEKCSDITVQFLCWAELVNNIGWNKSGSEQLSKWIQWLEKHREALPNNKGSQIQVSVLAALFLSSLYHFDIEIDREYWEKRAIHLMKKETDWLKILPLCVGIFNYCVYYSKFHYARFAIEPLIPLMNKIHTGPMNRTYWFITQVWYHYSITGDLKAARRHAEKALEFITLYKIKNLEFIALYCLVLTSLPLGQKKAVKGYLHRLSNLNYKDNSILIIRYNLAYTFQAIYEQNLNLALNYIENAIENAGNKDWHELLESLYIKTYLLFVLGRHEKALESANVVLQTTKKLPGASTEYFYHLISAYIFLKIQDEKQYEIHLKEIFAFLKKKDTFCMVHFLPNVINEIFTEAEKRNLEPEIAGQVIEKLQKSLKHSCISTPSRKPTGISKISKDADPVPAKQENDIIIHKIKEIFEVKKIYKNSELTLESLARTLEISRNRLSGIINDELKTSFYDLLRKYRIQDATRLLLQKNDLNILQIAHEAGFNNKVSFNSSFKEYTGMTPSQYRQKSTEHTDGSSLRNDQNE